MDLRGLASRANPVTAVSDGIYTARVLGRSGVIAPVRPDKLARILALMARWGTTPATGIATAAVHFPDETYIVDEAGELTFAEVHARTNALARDFRDRGVRAGDGVTPIMITGNDFASAWAMNSDGSPMVPTIPNDPMQRIYAFRGGINIVMYMLTGNYKSDQVHVPILLERLGN